MVQGRAVRGVLHHGERFVLPWVLLDLLMLPQQRDRRVLRDRGTMQRRFSRACCTKHANRNAVGGLRVFSVGPAETPRCNGCAVVPLSMERCAYRCEKTQGCKSTMTAGRDNTTDLDISEIYDN